MGILDELKKMSPEERAEARAFLAMQDAPAADTKAQEERKKNPPEAPKAGRVYFFRQIDRIAIEEVKRDGEGLKKTGHALPDRIIAVDEKSASKMFWKHKNKLQYLGRGDGRAWRQARIDGKSIGESQAEEFKAMEANPDRTPPPNNERTFFAGTKIGSAARGDQIPWQDGMKQQGSG